MTTKCSTKYPWIKDLLPVIVISGLTACAASPAKAPPPSRAEIIQSQVSEHIASSADRIHKQLAQLRAIQQVGVHQIPHPTPTSGPLTQPITLVWAGPLAPAVQSIADKINWGFRVEGVAPTIDPIVRIEVNQRPIYEVLRDLGLQAGRESGVIVDPQHHILTVSYSPDDNERARLGFGSRRRPTGSVPGPEENNHINIVGKRVAE